MAATLKTIFAQETKADAEAQWGVVADALREKQPKLGDLMDASRDDVLAYIDLPREHWAQIASTGSGTGIQRSPGLTGRLRFKFYPEMPFLDNGLTEILLEAIHLMHPLVEDGDDADVAI